MRTTRWLLALPFVVAAVVAATLALGGDSDDPRRIDLRATAPRFGSLDELSAAADLVVEGVVVEVDDGRMISDPADPSAGIRTRLARVRVEQVVANAAGGSPDVVIVEQEAALLDGTPITVNGVAPLEVGERAILLLVQGGDEQFPYTTPVNEQALFRVVGGVVDAADPGGAIGAGFDGRPVTALRAALGLEPS